jgi:hypothetical protein
MKVLVAIGSNSYGINQPIRDTWLKTIGDVGFDYKFFYGDGTLVKEDAAFLQSTRAVPTEYHDKLFSATKPSKTKDFVEDEVGLAVPDDHLHVPYKTQEVFLYALNHGFDFVFKCFEDTYVSLARLSASGFEKWDYTGRLCGNEHMGAYASGGPGYWVSERAMKALVFKPITRWADDWWVGNTLSEADIKLHIDSRYAELFDKNGGRPRLNNDVISSHLAVTPTVYAPAMMYEAHELATTAVQIKRGFRRWMQSTT